MESFINLIIIISSIMFFALRIIKNKHKYALVENNISGQMNIKDRIRKDKGFNQTVKEDKTIKNFLRYYKPLSFYKSLRFKKSKKGKIKAF